MYSDYFNSDLGLVIPFEPNAIWPPWPSWKTKFLFIVSQPYFRKNVTRQRNAKLEVVYGVFISII